MRLSVPIYKLKRNAKNIARDKNIPHSEALDYVANLAGFKNWSILSRAHSERADARRILSQFSNGDLVLLAARPGQGKTTFAMELAGEASAQGRIVHVYSLEETESQIIDRLVELGEPNSTRSRIEISDSNDICASMICEQLENCEAGTLVIVDYLQILDQSRTKPELRLQLAELQAFARRTGIIVVCISQIDRRFDASDNTIPGLGDVRLPNPVNMEVFSKTCFLHDGQMRLDVT